LIKKVALSLALASSLAVSGMAQAEPQSGGMGGYGGGGGGAPGSMSSLELLALAGLGILGGYAVYHQADNRTRGTSP